MLCKQTCYCWYYSQYSTRTVRLKSKSHPLTPPFTFWRKSQALSCRSWCGSPHPSRLHSVPATGNLHFPRTHTLGRSCRWVSTCFLCREPIFPREPRGLLPRFTQISSSQSSNITFSMGSFLTILLKDRSKYSPFLCFCLILLPGTYHHLICYILYLFILFTVCLFPLDCKPRSIDFFFFCLFAH